MHMYVQIYGDVHVCESSLPKTQYLNLALALQAHFLEWRLTHIGKELSIRMMHYITLYI